MLRRWFLGLLFMFVFDLVAYDELLDYPSMVSMLFLDLFREHPIIDQERWRDGCTDL